MSYKHEDVVSAAAKLLDVPPSCIHWDGEYSPVWCTCDRCKEKGGGFGFSPSVLFEQGPDAKLSRLFIQTDHTLPPYIMDIVEKVDVKRKRVAKRGLVSTSDETTKTLSKLDELRQRLMNGK